MAQYESKVLIYSFILLITLSLSGCKDERKEPDSKSLPDLNAQIRPYVTTENSKVRTGPGHQFRVIGEIGRDARINVVGRDGDWVLIVSKKGNPPGYIELSSIEPGSAESEESSARPAESKYESLVNTRVYSGPGLHYPVMAEIKKGTKLSVVEEEKGWLKVESKRGNKTGYVEASVAKPLGNQ